MMMMVMVRSVVRRSWIELVVQQTVARAVKVSGQRRRRLLGFGMMHGGHWVLGHEIANGCQNELLRCFAVGFAERVELLGLRPDEMGASGSGSLHGVHVVDIEIKLTKIAY